MKDTRTKPHLVTFGTPAGEEQRVVNATSLSDAAWRAAVHLTRSGQCSEFHHLSQVRPISAREVRALLATGVPAVPITSAA